MIDSAIENATNVARAEALVNAGWVDVGLNDVESAAQHFEQAATIFRDQLSTDHPRSAETLTYQARTAAWLGRHSNAVDLIQQAEQLDYARFCRDLGSASSAGDRVAMVQEARVHP